MRLPAPLFPEVGCHLFFPGLWGGKRGWGWFFPVPAKGFEPPTCLRLLAGGHPDQCLTARPLTPTGKVIMYAAIKMKKMYNRDYKSIFFKLENKIILKLHKKYIIVLVKLLEFKFCQQYTKNFT